MISKNTTFAWLKTFACLAFVFALVLSPPSASHAASGMQGDHHTAQVVVDISDTNHAHDADPSASLHKNQAYVSVKSDIGQASEQCCGDICLSVVLNDSRSDFVIQTSNGKYQPLYAQTYSIEPSGFLRPPQFLI